MTSKVLDKYYLSRFTLKLSAIDFFSPISSQRNWILKLNEETKSTSYNVAEAGFKTLQVKVHALATKPYFSK